MLCELNENKYKNFNWIAYNAVFIWAFFSLIHKQTMRLNLLFEIGTYIKSVTGKIEYIEHILLSIFKLVSVQHASVYDVLNNPFDIFQQSQFPLISIQIFVENGYIIT